MEQKVLAYIRNKKLIRPGHRIIVAVSGGADSMALLHFFKIHQDVLQCEIAAAHLHHGIRSETADRDAQTVRDYCKLKSVPFYFKKVDIPKLAKSEKMSLEVAGRQARYQFFDEIMNQEGYDLVATAHHMDDQAETLTLRLIRGTGLKGACGILSKQSQIIRPFLCVCKKEIENYCNDHGLIYQEDETNADIEFSRNRIRHQIMPVLSEINPEANRHLSAFCEKMTETEVFLAHVIDKTEESLFNQHLDYCEIESFVHQHIYLQKEILRRRLGWAAQTMTDIEQRHIDLILAQLSRPTSVWQLEMPHYVRVRRSYDRLYFEKKADKDRTFECFDLPLDTPGIYEIADFRWKVEILLTKDLIISEYHKKRCEIYLNCGTIIESVCIRSRRPGDRISLLGMRGHKKVKKLLIDRKIFREARDHLPMLAMGSEILWIPNVAVDRRCIHPDPDSETTIKISVERINEPGY